MSVSRKISVIVPLFNVSPYVNRLIQALCRQDPSLIEVIFVDDGSTDNTVSALRQAIGTEALAAPWRILSKRNGGLSDARNFGIEHSDLPYVAFLDPDDEVSESYYAVLMEQVEKTGASIALSSSIEVWQTGKTRSAIYSDAVYETTSDLSWLFSYDWSACTKVFSRDLFATNQFDKGLRFEDLALVPYLVAKAGKLCVSQEAIYYYHRREDSITLDRDISKEKDILLAIDMISDRLGSLSHGYLIWGLMQKVLIMGFIPSVTTRYSAATSREFALLIQDYILRHKPVDQTFSISPRDLMTRFFLTAPGTARWVITGLYRAANWMRK